MDKENKFLGITVGGGHSNEIKNLRDPKCSVVKRKNYSCKNSDDYNNKIENTVNIDDFWKILFNLYKENSHQFSMEERIDRVKNINEIINDNIENLENVLINIVHYKRIEFNEINDINLIDYNDDSKPNYFKEKFLKVLHKLVKLINKSKSIRIKFNKEDSDLKIKSKNYWWCNNDLKYVAMNLMYYKILYYELFKESKPSDNSELINKRNEHLNVKVIPSENNLIIDENIESLTADILKSDDTSEDIKEAIFNDFEYNIKNSNDEKLVEETFNYINEKKHKYKIIKFFKWVKNYNSLIHNVNIKEYTSNGESKNNKGDIEHIKLSNSLEMAVALNEIEHSKNTDFDKLSNIEAFAIFVASNKDGNIKDAVPDLRNWFNKVEINICCSSQS
ncbi:hypothetical protein U3516DRAFT_767940 [Neocallimastix sp. 'constans']